MPLAGILILGGLALIFTVLAVAVWLIDRGAPATLDHQQRSRLPL